MMNYEDFKKEVTEQFINYMPEEYRDMNVKVNTVDKVNVQMDGIILTKDDNITASPTIYINSMYADYQKNDFNTVMQEAADMMTDAMKYTTNIFNAINYDNARENIVFQLINTEQNKGMLADMPHRKFQDLSVIYRWVIKVDNYGIQSTRINNSLAERLGLNEEQLFKQAAENTKRILPPVCKSMKDILYETLLDGVDSDIADIMIGEMPQEEMMWVITNATGHNGAASMLYEEELHTLAQKLKTDLYILPSSIHEVIAVSAEMGDPAELAAMVKEINMHEVSLEDRLSNQVYHYDKDSRKLTLATDTPYKKLDDVKVKEQELHRAIHMGGQVR